MKTLVLALLAAFALSSCATPKPDVAQVRKTIEEMTQKSARALASGVWDTTLATYTDDVVSMPNGGPMLKGKEAIRAHMTQMMGMGMKFTNVNFTTRDVQVSGDFAYEIGTYKMTIAMQPMGEMTDEGKYLSVYERAGAGLWKIKVETWNTKHVSAHVRAVDRRRIAATCYAGEAGTVSVYSPSIRLASLTI